MVAQHDDAWQSWSQQVLKKELNKIRQCLLMFIGAESANDNSETENIIKEQEDIAVAALDRLCELFDLTYFEKQLLLLCAGIEFDDDFAFLCAKAQGDSQKAYPTLSLALKLFKEGDFAAITPEAPLRRWQLIEINNFLSLYHSPLKINERILFYLQGDNSIDKSLLAWVKPIRTTPYLLASHLEVARQIEQRLEKRPKDVEQALPVLFGNDIFNQQNIALLVSDHRESILLQIKTLIANVTGAELSEIGRLLFREALLNNFMYFIVYEESHEPARLHNIMQLASLLQGYCIFATQDPLHYQNKIIYNVEAKKPLLDEQNLVWETLLKNVDNYPIADLSAHYNFGIAEIITAYSALATEQATANPLADMPTILWKVCRQHSYKQLEGLARRIECKASWNDIILPEQQLHLLREITLQVKQRYKVYYEWGFAKKCSRGLGINALFAGPSGTGKTLAAEVIAKELQLDLYQIELSAIVSKYIGETEKNLQKIFQIAEGSGAILLFDEADALFGKRSDVKDSHDRYANMEVSYLLQRMEAYSGLSILTTNLKSAIDQAFLRRLRFIVNFPFPEQVEREMIWRRIFPEHTPLQNIDFHKLGRLNVSGGNIYSIGLNAAFTAANAGEPIQMRHLLRATHSEYLKLGKTPSLAEIGDWV